MQSEVKENKHKLFLLCAYFGGRNRANLAGFCSQHKSSAVCCCVIKSIMAFETKVLMCVSMSMLT